MRFEEISHLLTGRIVRLEPQTTEHIDALAVASATDRELYKWGSVPNGREETRAYVEKALAWQQAGTALPFVIIRQSDKAIVGSTRFFNIERWDWPLSHVRHGHLDAAEIGYSWLRPDAIGTGANVEAKLMLLTAAFDACDLLRICFHTDIRNERSRSALQALGAEFEGFLRAHRLAVDLTPRTSARFSILRTDWPRVREQLTARLARREPAK